MKAQPGSNGHSNPTPSRPTGKSSKTGTLPDDLERERLEPGLNTAGSGDVGADPSRPHGPENSNT